MQNPLLNYISTTKQDAVIFKADWLMKEAGDDLHKQDEAIQSISNMLSCLDSDVLLEKYTNLISKKNKIKPATISKLVKQEAEKKNKIDFQVVEEGKKALPKWIDKDKFYAVGFDWRVDTENKDNTGIYFAFNNNDARQLTNFTIKPLIHVVSEDADSNRRLTEINNGYGTAIIQLPSKAWSSVDQFESTLMDQGVFFTYDGFTKSHLNKLKATFLKMYPKCYELKTLGWQPEGFFAYSNLILHDGKQVNFNEYGVAEVDGKNFLSMGASSALNDVREEDDIYKNDKYLRYVYTELSLTKWSELMVDVYSDNGMMGVCWVLLAAFKDIIFKRNNNCPVPYAYGAVQAGKSKFAESVANVFTHQMPAFNLNQGTDYAFFERMERFRNVPMLFNEFDENAIKEEWFRAIKGAFDGEGRAKGSGRRNKTKTQDINCLPVLIGQYLSTKDDGSVLQRSIPVKFVEVNNRPREQEQKYDLLKSYEQQGITSIAVEILKHRKYVRDNYLTRFDEVSQQLKAALAKENVIGKNRIVENYSNALTLIKLIGERVQLAFDFDRFFQYCAAQVIGLSSVISESNALSEFWKVIEFLLDQDMIEQGYHFKVEAHTDVRIQVDRNNVVKKTFNEPKKLLFLRFNSVHSLYLQEKRKQTGKNGLNAETILTYMRDQAYYIGNSPAGTFKSLRDNKSMNTSSFVFDYELLAVNLERMVESADPREAITITGEVYTEGKVIDVLGNMKVNFKLLQDESYEHEGKQVEKKVYTSCYWKEVDRYQELRAGAKVTLTGFLDERKTGSGVFRSFDAQKIEFKLPELFNAKQVPDEDLPF